VRLSGKSYAHPLVVIVADKGQAEYSRAGIITAKSIGKAVERNRARRRLRVILAQYLEKTTSAYDMVVIGRTPISEASFQELKSAVGKLMVRAGILDQNDSML